MNVKSKHIRERDQRSARKSLAAVAFSGLMLLTSCGGSETIVTGRLLECAGQKQCRVLVNSGSLLLHTETKGAISSTLSVSRVDADRVTFTTSASASGSDSYASGTQAVPFGETADIFRMMTVSVERGPTKNTAYVILHQISE